MGPRIDDFGIDPNGAEFPEDAQIEVMDQPLEERLHFKSKLHADILNRLTARREMSERHMATRYDIWDRADEHCRCYIDLSRKARKADGSTDNSRLEMPFTSAIVIPLSYTLLWTRLVGLMSIFVDRDPILPVSGTAGASDIASAKYMDAMLAYDARQMIIDLVLFAMSLSAEKYGIGVLFDEFHYQSGWTYEDNPLSASPVMSAVYKNMMGSDPPRVKVFGIKSEYNKWTSVDVFKFWPDPRVSLTDVKNMEFVGHTVQRSYLHLVENIMPNGPYIEENVKELRKKSSTDHDSRDSAESNRSRSRGTVVDSAINSSDENDKGSYQIDQMQVKLIPKDWNLSEVDKPQVWQFAWADDSTIIRGHDSKYDHGEFGYSVGEVNHDPHVLFNPGNTELQDGFQRMMNWMFNSHVENVRRTVNNVALYGPTYIEEDDLLNPGPAGHIRFTPRGEELIGRGIQVSNFFRQANVTDVTSGNMTLVNSMFDMAMKMAAVNEPSMGQVTESKRTLGELQRVIFSQEKRIGLSARLLDSLAVRPAVGRAIINRQQFTTLERFFQIVGDEGRNGTPPMAIGREHVLGNYDYISNTGVIPPDPARFGQMWVEIMVAAGKIPQLHQPVDGKVLDIRKMFDEFARTTGARDIERFYRDVDPQVQVMGDEEVARERQAGNLIPAPDIADPIRSATMRG